MSDIGRASVLIGSGTIVSRLTGFLRTVVLVTAIGSQSAAGNAFAIANQLPNNIYAIISTGILTAVIVPQIVKAGGHTDGGRAFVSKLLTLGTMVLLATTVIAVALAPVLVQLYQPRFSPEQAALSTAFAYWCLPQIFFYGLYALLGETLNARRVFGPYNWAPIVNNLVSIAGFVAFIAVFGARSGATGWTSAMVALLAGTATLGIVLQTVVLLLFWRRAGLAVRPDFHWRGVGLRHIGQLAGWTFLMVLVGQLAGIVQTRVFPPEGSPGVFASQNAWLLFMLPYSIIVLSIGTPYFTRLSEHAEAGRHDEVRADMTRSIRTLGVFIVVATAALAVAAEPASRVFSRSAAEAQTAALVLLCYLVALVPLAVQFVVQRTFYAYHDTRTPFLFTLLQGVLVVITALIASATVPTEFLAAGVALGQSLSNIVQLVVATWLLNRRLGGLQVRSWVTAHARFAVAALPAAGAGWLTYLLMGGATGWTMSSQLLGAVGAAIIGAVCVVVYAGVLAVLRAPELDAALTLLRRAARR